tara:strand:- start:1544 stop:1798 length:255 start_codon:yes stop_codon:yes gene_type:complete
MQSTHAQQADRHPWYLPLIVGIIFVVAVFNQAPYATFPISFLIPFVPLDPFNTFAAFTESAKPIATPSLFEKLLAAGRSLLGQK